MVEFIEHYKLEIHVQFCQVVVYFLFTDSAARFPVARAFAPLYLQKST